MTKGEKIEIPLSKYKLALLLSASILFVLGGIWSVVNPKSLTTHYSFRSPELIFSVGAGTILFFGLCAIFIFRKIADDKPGLIIDNTGINDNSGGTSAGFIPWKDIGAIKKTAVFNQKIVLIMVDNPEDYTGKQTGFIVKTAMRMNYRTYGSPICLSANGLKCGFDELYEAIVSRFQAQCTSVE